MSASALVAGPAGMMLFTEVNTEKRQQHHSGTLLTARTLAGERTVDLSRIERVRLLTYFSRSGVSQRVLLVRDAWGMSLGLTSPASHRALRRALERLPRRGPRPRMFGSRAAPPLRRAAVGLPADQAHAQSYRNIRIRRSSTVFDLAVTLPGGCAPGSAAGLGAPLRGSGAPP
ncbi:hypothetical protein [Streptomyces sp. NPDC088794]|uniref:hypothetical protein n=1 Tax=Streptomyces sp. NPDC088794 TaxID=3365902 RepID=UPI00381FC0CC